MSKKTILYKVPNIRVSSITAKYFDTQLLLLGLKVEILFEKNNSYPQAHCVYWSCRCFKSKGMDTSSELFSKKWDNKNKGEFFPRSRDLNQFIELSWNQVWITTIQIWVEFGSILIDYLSQLFELNFWKSSFEINFSKSNWNL